MPTLQPPTDPGARHWTATPSRTVFAVFDNQAAAEATAERLERSHIAEGGIRILSGQEGLEELDPTGERHGLQGRLAHAMQQLSDVLTLLESYGEAISAGKSVMAVHFQDKSERNRIAAILIDSGGTRISYMSDWTITEVVERRGMAGRA